MSLNNTVAKGNACDILLAAFPLVASAWELWDAVIETVSTCQIHGWLIHIPLMGIFYLVLVFGLTFGQYALANSIARRSGWSSNMVNSGLEIALLAYSLLT